MSCPTDEVLAAWAAGALGADEHARLEDHAAGCASCRGLAVALAGVVPATGGAGLGAEGATVGRYRIVGAAGHGAMGIVLRGHDPVLDRDVAIKMINSAAASADQRARMLAEAQTLARIDHPSVVRVYDAGVVGDEVFVAMAFVDGPTLASWLASGPHGLAESVAILRSVGAGIAAVHAVGLVHRDIKPDNILVDDGVGVLVDLGLARPVAGARGSGIAGTERYLAPEVRAGKSATAASDQYAWCVVVAETLGDVAMTAARRAAIDRVIARGRADDPAMRFGSLDDAIAALVRATAPPRPRWPYALALTAGVAVALVTLRALTSTASDACARSVPSSWTFARPVIAGNLRATGADATRVVAAIDARADRYATLRAETCRATGLPASDDRTRAAREQLCTDVAWTGTEHIFSGLETPDPRVARAAVDELITVLPLDRCATAAIPAVPGPPPPALAHEAAAVEAALRAIRFGSDRDPSHRIAALHALEPRIVALGYAPMLEGLHSDLAGAFAASGDGSGSKRELEQVVTIGETAGDDDARTRALINLLRQAYDAGSRDTDALQRSAEAASARLGNPAITAELAMSEAMAAYTRGDLSVALAAMHRAATLFDSVAVDANAQLVAVAQNLGGIEQATGDLAAAQATYDRGYALARARFGDADVETLEIRGARATNLMALHRAREARPELAAVAAGLAHGLGDAAPVAQARGYVCEADLEVADHAAAITSCAGALALAERVYGADHPQLAWTLTMTGRAHIAAGDPGSARAPLERAIALTSRAAVAPTDHAVAQAYLAVALVATDPARARGLAREAVSALAADPETAELRAELARLFPAR